MQVWTCTDHDGFWPVGVASVVWAYSEDQARAVLKAALKERGLDAEQPFTLQHLRIDRPSALILRDGEY